MPATDPATFALAVVTDLRNIFLPAMQAEGETQQAEMRQLISVPVQYVPLGTSTRQRPGQSGSRPGPGLTQRDTGAGGIHLTTVNGKTVVVVRSKRGEPPRKEFGLLYKSMTTETVVEGDTITTRMGSDDDIAGYSASLEDRLKRPHFQTVFENVERYAVDRILARLPQTF